MSAVVHHPRAVELVARRNLRRQVERAVSRLIALLDELDGDPDLEPWLGDGDDRELENEHGGDINDDPHDAEPDEPSL